MPPPDHTATLAPRDATTVASASPPERETPCETLPVDDPERYEQIGEHARGGLGRVVRAIDKRLGRTVAVKELLRHDEWHEARFVREALITARLEHPGIVPVHEAGRWPNGDPYYVMKLVEGRTLKVLLTERTTLRERLALLGHVIAIADAVGYAHSEGVVHRDIKPSNVIVGEFGETIVIDWGLARDRKQDLPEPQPQLTASGSGSSSTISGKVIGTPGYMAPEQARGEIVDERADVYAIGALLYELLTGGAPHADTTPQAMLDRVIAGPPAPLAQVAPNVPRELADIVAKAMSRAPDDRYPNASALAEDLRRFQTGKLVSAHAYTTWQIIRKKLAQHRGVVAVGVASAIALAAVGVESFRTVVAQRDIARAERARAEEARYSAEARKRELTLVQAETSLRKDPTAALAWLKGYAASEQDRAQVVDVIDEALALGVARHVFRPNDWVHSASFTRDGKHVVATVRDGSVRVYDLATGTMTVAGRTPSAPEILALAPDGSFAVVGGMLGEVIVVGLHGEPSRTLVAGGRMITRIRFVAGQRIVVDREAGPDQIIDLASGTITKVGPDNALRVAVARDDLSRVAAILVPNQIAVLEAGKPRVVATTDRAVYHVSLSPSGDTVFAHDGKTLYSVPYAGGALTKVATFEAKLNAIEWTPDRKTYALIGTRSDVTLVDAATGKLSELRGHTDSIYTGQFSSDGKSLLTASDDGTARVWNLADNTSAHVLRGHDDDVYSAAFSPDEKLVVTSSLDMSLRVWELDRSNARTLVEGKGIELMNVKGDTALVNTKSTLARWNLTTGTREQLFAWDDVPNSLGIGIPSPDGEALVLHAPGNTLEVRRRSGPPVILRGHRGLIHRVEWSHDSKSLLTSSADGTLRRWDLATGAFTMVIEAEKPVRGFIEADDGRIVAIVGDAASPTIMLARPDAAPKVLEQGPEWCIAMLSIEKVRGRLILHTCARGLLVIDRDNDKLTELPTDGYTVVHVAVSPDGNRIAGAMGDRTVRIWDSSGRLLETLRGHTDLVMNVAFSPDGDRVASASYDKTIRIWELGTARHRVLRGHLGPVNQVQWRNAHELVTASMDGTLKIWPVPPTALPTQTEVTARLDAATTASIDKLNRATSSAN